MEYKTPIVGVIDEKVNKFIEAITKELITPHENWCKLDSMLDTPEEELEKSIRAGIANYLKSEIKWNFYSPFNRRIKGEI